MERMRRSDEREGKGKPGGRTTQRSVKRRPILANEGSMERGRRVESVDTKDVEIGVEFAEIWELGEGDVEDDERGMKIESLNDEELSDSGVQGVNRKCTILGVQQRLLCNDPTRIGEDMKVARLGG